MKEVKPRQDANNWNSGKRKRPGPNQRTTKEKVDLISREGDVASAPPLAIPFLWRAADERDDSTKKPKTRK